MDFVGGLEEDRKVRLFFKGLGDSRGFRDRSFY